MAPQIFWVLPLATFALGGVVGGGVGAPGSERPSSPGHPVADVVHQRVSADSLHSCALTPSGKAICWGEGQHGRLGNGDDSPQDRPIAVAGELSFVSISTGLQHTCALTAEGDAWCWGRGHVGRLGNGATSNESSPVKVAGGQKFVSISVGRNHSCGVTAEGKGYCWGYGADGKLGNGSTTSAMTPTEVKSSIRFKTISAGSYVTCGISTDGPTYCWGSAKNGKRGDGETNGIAYDPREVLGGHRFASIYAGHQYVCALTTEGEAYCWGSNSSGQLGDGTTTNRAEPVAVGGGKKFTTLSIGKYHACGTTESGTAYCWGSNGRGKAGVGRSRGGNIYAPEPVANVNNFASLGAGHDHTCGITTDNKLYCWGNAGSGRLGTGSTSNRASPELVADLSALALATAEGSTRF